MSSSRSLCLRGPSHDIEIPGRIPTTDLPKRLFGRRGAARIASIEEDYSR